MVQCIVWYRVLYGAVYCVVSVLYSTVCCLVPSIVRYSVLYGEVYCMVQCII